MRSRGEVPGKKKKLSGRWRTIIVSPFIVGLYAPFGPRWLRLRLRRRTVQLPAEPHVVSCLGTPQREMLAAALIGSMKEKVLEVGSKREIVTRGSLSDLVDGHWIGDEVINAFLVVLQVSAHDSLCTDDGVREIQSYTNTSGGNGNPGLERQTCFDSAELPPLHTQRMLSYFLVHSPDGGLQGLQL